MSAWCYIRPILEALAYLGGGFLLVVGIVLIGQWLEDHGPKWLPTIGGILGILLLLFIMGSCYIERVHELCGNAVTAKVGP